MRISDWSSDVCSSDLSVEQRITHLRDQGGVDRVVERLLRHADGAAAAEAEEWRQHLQIPILDDALADDIAPGEFGEIGQIGRASCRERGCKYVEIQVVAGPLKKKNNTATLV